jgi:hypothetical protein
MWPSISSSSPLCWKINADEQSILNGRESVVMQRSDDLLTRLVFEASQMVL